jgi:hypothetical protein
MRELPPGPEGRGPGGHGPGGRGGPGPWGPGPWGPGPGGPPGRGTGGPPPGDHGKLNRSPDGLGPAFSRSGGSRDPGERRN